MEAETGNTNTQLGFLHRLGPAIVPVLLISIGYVDPGKWVVTIEGGARFGYDLVAIMLIFNLAAILCQYVAARITVATGRNLAQICSDEYDKWTCMFIGAQVELSAILLDLTMILGVAHALNILFGSELSTGLLLAAVDAVLFPVFATILDNRATNTLSICLAGLILVLYVSGVLFSQPEIPLSVNGILTRLNGESAFSLMSLLGANIMPHNFYLHSYFARETAPPLGATKSSLCHDHFFAIVSVFSGLCLVNYVLMNAAANVFHSTGLVLLTFQDAMSLMEQVFRSPLVPVALLVLVFFSNQITAFAWSLGGEVVLHDFLKIDMPGWLHRATIRILTTAIALYCVWTSGAEGIYQLLVCTHVLVALMLPSSVIPLFRVASSRQIMDVYKIPQIVEFLALIIFMGMLGLKIIFVVEMLFGSSDWAGSLSWNIGISTSVPYVSFLITGCASLCLMLWLAATPLKSANNRLDVRALNWDSYNAVRDPFIREEKTEIDESRRHKEEPVEMQEPLPLHYLPAEAMVLASAASVSYDVPETLLMPDPEIHSSPLEEKNFSSVVKFVAPRVSLGEESEVKEEGSVSQSTVVNEVGDDLAVETKTVKIESASPAKKTASIENTNNRCIEKDDDEVDDTWEPEETPKVAPVSTSSFVSDGPPSFRSLSGKSDEGGSGMGSLSRLAGLGRAARRQLAAVLDEFWGQFYDFHGQIVADAKAKKLDLLLGVDSRTASSVKSDSSTKEIGGCLGRGSNSHISSSLYDSLNRQRMPESSDSSYGIHGGSYSPLSDRMQLLDAYVNSNNRNVVHSGERRYSSLHIPPSSGGRDYQPATVHGYQFASYLKRLANQKSLDALQAQGELPTSRSPSLGSMSYTEQLAFALRQKTRNGLSSGPPGFQNRAVSRNIPPQSEISFSDFPSSASADIAMEKRYRSLPDISGLSVPSQDPCLAQNGSTGYVASFGRAINDPSICSNSGSRIGAPLAFDKLSPSRRYRDAFTLPRSTTSDTGSLWSRQPFEQFGVSEESGTLGNEGLQNRSNSKNREFTFPVDSEAKLLQSFRGCIVKLLKLEGSDWLFRQNVGAEEELIDRVAAREKFIYEAETRDINQVVQVGEPLVLSVPHCGDGCIWRADLVVSFGIWCIHRILDLSLMESRPELWGKYTYVLNRLQGVIDPAFSKPRTPMSPCFCLQIPATHQQRASPPSISNEMLPPAAKPARGKCTVATLLDLVKDVEIAISCRKGRSGTAAGDVAFPKGKENLASVLKRYKRRLSSKTVATTQEGSGLRKNVTSTAYGS